MPNILIDTNIWIDLLARRAHFFEHAAESLAFLAERGYKLYTTTTTITDIFYICCERLKISENQIKQDINALILSNQLAVVNRTDILYALSSERKDFEDSLQISAAISNDCRYILTRNPKDFENSMILAVTPEKVKSIL